MPLKPWANKWSFDKNNKNEFSNPLSVTYNYLNTVQTIAFRVRQKKTISKPLKLGQLIFTQHNGRQTNGHWAIQI